MSRRAGERIYYVVPEDGDDEAHPNYFVLPGPSGLEVKLNDVKHFFPLGAANFHFRFLQAVGSMKAWVDVSEDTMAVPRFEGSIVFKASRLTTGDEESSKLGGFKSFLASAVGDDESQPVGKLKSYLSKAYTSFTKEEETTTAATSPTSSHPLRRAASATMSRPLSTGRLSSDGESSPKRDPSRDGGANPVVSPNQQPQQPRISNPRSATNLQEQARNKTAPVARASPPKAPPNNSPPALPQRRQAQQQPAAPPPSDLLGLDHSPLHTSGAQATPAQTPQQPQKQDWHAFVGLDATQQPQQPAPTPVMQPPPAMRNVPQQQAMDPFRMQQMQQQQQMQQRMQYQARPRGYPPQQQQPRPGGSFDAFGSFS
mmetsp:Transcript_23599/g.72596  ORF Transcript_23599/g.72596 Transcript_23599/m.72596 type:complete len:370 (+) Transcript_23599:67-1176(+)